MAVSDWPRRQVLLYSCVLKGTVGARETGSW